MPRGRKPGDANEGKLRKSHRLSEHSNAVRETPPCPPWLSAIAKQEWNAIVPKLVEEKVLYATHFSLLAAYCQAYGLWRQASDQIQLEGLQVEDYRDVLVPHPLLRVEAQKLSEMRKIAELFGLTPKSRSQVSMPAGSGNADELDEFETFLED